MPESPRQKVDIEGGSRVTSVTQIMRIGLPIGLIAAIAACILIAIAVIAIVQATGYNMRTLFSPTPSPPDARTVVVPAPAIIPSSTVNPIDTIMSNALLGEHLISGAVVDTGSIVADARYGAMDQDGFAVWQKPLSYVSEVPLADLSGVTIRYAISYNGEFYVGVVGPKSETLALLIGRNEWWPKALSLRDLLLYRALRQEYLRLENDGYVSGGHGLDGHVEIWSKYSETVHVMYSALMMFEDYNGEWLYADRLDTWDPSGVGETNYTGDTWRSLDISYSENMYSFVYSHCHNDNGNTSYVKLEEDIVVSCGPSIGPDDAFQIDGQPATIEMGGHRTWSEVDASVHIIVVGDSVTSSNHQEYPSDSDNPAPSILLIPPGVRGEESSDTTAVSYYYNDFTDLEGWVQEQGLINGRCRTPILQEDSNIYAIGSGGAGGYVELPAPVVSDSTRPLIVEIRFRYDDYGGLFIGLFERDDYPCGEGSNDGFAFAMGGEGRDRYNFTTDEGSIIVDANHDGEWHIARLTRNESGYWSMYIDDILMGRGTHQDRDSNYRYLSVQAYAGSSAIAEIDYILVQQE